jgi:polyphosphate kinase
MRAARERQPSNSEGLSVESEYDWRPEPRMCRIADGRLANEFLDAPYPYADRLAGEVYRRQLQAMQMELVKLQAAMKANGRRLVVLFEGRDAAGKGGTIKRFMQHLNPRGARIVALDKPSDVERGQWYFQRYIEHLPTAGEIVLFDRSWYNRSGVERVMGFCTEAEYASFLRQTVEIERNLRESGITLVKVWLLVSRDEQRRRFEQRAKDPLRSWKLSAMDLASMQKYHEYSAAERAVFTHTATPENPWVVIKSDCKRRARLQALGQLLTTVDYPGKDPSNIEPGDPLVLSVISHL